MLIILEGCDGAGKTEFARLLAATLGRNITDIAHLGPPERDPLVECLNALLGYRPRSGSHRIVDRLHLGELIYGPIYRGESKLAGKTNIVHHRINVLGGLLVLLDPPLSVIEERVHVRGDDYVKQSDLAKIHQLYREVTGSITDIPVMTVDTRNQNALPQVLRYASLLEQNA